MVGVTQQKPSLPPNSLAFSIISIRELGLLPGGTRVIAAAQQTGRKVLTSEDDFVRQQSSFDRQSRLNLSREAAEVTRAMYFDYVAAQVMAWNEDEVAALTHIVSAVHDKFARLNFPLPAEVIVIKTSGQEEGYAAYTRHLNAIALPANMVASLAGNASWGDPLHAQKENLSYLQDVFIHECFHLFSKNNPQRRDALYALVGYQPTGQSIELPAAVVERKITNPDTPVMNTYIEMEVAEGEGPIALAPVLLANAPYKSGRFFDYLGWFFIAIEERGEGHWQPVLAENGEPVLCDSKNLLDQYERQIGYNLTGELFHPDEIMAQNFVFVANLPSLGLLSSMAGLLSS